MPRWRLGASSAHGENSHQSVLPVPLRACGWPGEPARGRHARRDVGGTAERLRLGSTRTSEEQMDRRLGALRAQLAPAAAAEHQGKIPTVRW